MTYYEPVEKYYDDCHHLDSFLKNHRCLKRWFKVLNIRHKEYQKIYICSELYSLLYKNYIEDGDSEWRVKDIILKRVLINSYDFVLDDFYWSNDRCVNWSNNGSRWDEFTYRVCDRPFLKARTTIEDATLFFMENSRYEFFTFWEDYLKALRVYADYHLQFKKYKKQHKELNIILNRLNRRGNIFNYEDEIKEFLNIIMELKLNKQVINK
jgi:hypothetical protein